MYFPIDENKIITLFEEIFLLIFIKKSMEHFEFRYSDNNCKDV